MDERRVVKQAYDEMAEDYIDRVGTESSSEPVEPVRRFRDELDPEDDLLDAGCGPGSMTLAKAGEAGVGLDISREQLSLARRNETVRRDMEYYLIINSTGNVTQPMGPAIVESPTPSC